MNKRWIAATLSLSMSVGLLAGCGTSPTAAPESSQPMVNNPVPAPNVGPIDPRAQEGVVEAPDAGMPGAQPAPVPGDVTVGDGMTPPVGAPVTPVGGIGGVPIVAAPGAFGPTGEAGIIAFQSDRDTGGGLGMDIFVYDANAATVLALPGVNTFANESNPRLSSNGRWLVYQSDELGSEDILLFDLGTQLINTLQTLNTEFSNEFMPDIANSGDLLVYVSDQAGYDELRVYDVLTGANFRVPVANRGLDFITWPTISGNGDIIAYGASPDGWCDTSDIFVYSVRDAAQLTPPFINTPFGEYNPELSLAGDVVLFVSNRRGTEDIYAVDLTTGFTDNLVLANTDFASEQEPRFLGGMPDAIVFQSDRTSFKGGKLSLLGVDEVKDDKDWDKDHKDKDRVRRYGQFRLYAYDLRTALLNTLPVANEPFTNTQLRDEFPDIKDFDLFKFPGKWRNGGHDRDRDRDHDWDND